MLLLRLNKEGNLTEFYPELFMLLNFLYNVVS